MRVCVFGSSSPRTPKPYLEAAFALGERLAKAGHICVNGAGRTGCMGAVNDGCLQAGGRVEGVILQKFLDEGLEHTGLHSLIAADTMRERKRLLGEGVDAYMVLPGGPGTWEEFWEVAVERQIATHIRPVIVLNINGFYDGFLAQAQRGHDEGFLYGAIDDLFTVASDVPTAIDLLLG